MTPIKTPYLIILLAIFSTSLLGCGDKYVIEKELDGLWAVDTLYNSRYDLQDCLFGNLLSFKKSENSVNLPTTSKLCVEVHYEEMEGYYEIVDSNGSIEINIESGNLLFNGSNRLRFVDDKKNEVLRLVIQSDSCYLVATKILYPYRDKAGTIRRIVNVTN